MNPRRSSSRRCAISRPISRSPRMARLQGGHRRARRRDESRSPPTRCSRPWKSRRRARCVHAGDQPALAPAGDAAQPLLTLAAGGPTRAEAAQFLEAARGAGPWDGRAGGHGRRSVRAARRRSRGHCAAAQRHHQHAATRSAAAIFSRQRWRIAGRAATLRCAWHALRAGSQNASWKRGNPRRNALVRGGQATEDMSPIRALGRHSRHAQACPHFDQQDHGG